MNLGFGSKAPYYCRAVSRACLLRPVTCVSSIFWKISCFEPQDETHKYLVALLSFSMELFTVISSSPTKSCKWSSLLARQDPIADTLGCLDLEFLLLLLPHQHLEFHLLNLHQLECQVHTRHLVVDLSRPPKYTKVSEVLVLLGKDRQDDNLFTTRVRINFRNSTIWLIHFHAAFANFNHTPSMMFISS